MVQPYGMVDDLGWKPMARVGGWPGYHSVSLALTPAPVNLAIPAGMLVSGNDALVENSAAQSGFYTRPISRTPRPPGLGAGGDTAATKHWADLSDATADR